MKYFHFVKKNYVCLKSSRQKLVVTFSDELWQKLAPIGAQIASEMIPNLVLHLFTDVDRNDRKTWGEIIATMTIFNIHHCAQNPLAVN